MAAILSIILFGQPLDWTRILFIVHHIYIYVHQLADCGDRSGNLFYTCQPHRSSFRATKTANLDPCGKRHFKSHFNITCEWIGCATHTHTPKQTHPRTQSFSSNCVDKDLNKNLCAQKYATQHAHKMIMTIMRSSRLLLLIIQGCSMRANFKHSPGHTF